MASCLAEEIPSSSAGLQSSRSRRSTGRCEQTSDSLQRSLYSSQKSGLRSTKHATGRGGPALEEIQATKSCMEFWRSRDLTRGSSSGTQHSAAHQSRRCSISGDRVGPAHHSSEEGVRRTSLDVLRWLDDAHSSYTAGLTTVDVEAASSSPECPRMTSKDEALDLFQQSRPGRSTRSTRRLSVDSGTKGAKGADEESGIPARTESGILARTESNAKLEAALQLRRERRGQRRLDRMVRRMSLLDRKNSISDGSFDWLKPEEVKVNLPADEEEQHRSLSAPEKMLSHSTAHNTTSFQ